MRFFPWVLSFFLCATAGADPVPPTWDFDRLQGFAEHKSTDVVHDREREKGKVLFVEEAEQWERDRRRALTEHRKTVKLQSPQENGPEDLADRREKAEQKKEDEKVRREYVREKLSIEKQSRFRRPVSEMEELGLADARPRFDVRKRMLYGGNAKPGSSRPSFGGGSPGNAGPINYPPPAPPTGYDDFPPPPSDPYVPPPMPDDMANGDFPPPVPPMSDEGMDFPPPPPPAFPPDMPDFPPPIMPEGF